MAVTAVGLFGLAGNCLTVIVLRKTETNRQFNKLLVSLAVIDSVLIVFVVGETAVLGKFLGSAPDWFNVSYPYVIHPLKGMVQTGTIYMVVAVSAERYKAICFPLR